MASAYLEIETPQGAERRPLGDDPLTIGRHEENALLIEDERASRFHCVVEKVGDQYRLRDLKSRNGTKLNESPVESAVLRSGDVFRVGKTRFRFVDPEAMAVEVPGGEAEPEPMRKAPQLRRSHGAGVVEEPSRSGGGSKTRKSAALSLDDDVDYNALLQGLSPQETLPPAEDYRRVLEEFAAAGQDQRGDLSTMDLVSASGKVLHAAEIGDGAPASRPRKSRDEDAESREGVQLLRLLLLVCMRTRATDLHVEPKADSYILRLRVDGTMVDAVRLNRGIASKLVGVIKVLSDIDIAQRLIVQEGHFSAQVGVDRRIDYRVSFTPSMYGQKLVLRVLDLYNAPQFIHQLELPAWMMDRLRKLSRQDSGMLLVCGPTGSGKTTTLYTVLREIDVRQRNVITIEDPVEYHLDGVTQIPIDQNQGNTFSTLLRSVLRQDPDVILLGEIRDQETAAIAMQAAMTGHLVLSTVHAKDSIGTVFRLLDLGVEPYLVASSLNLVLAQRLVRVLCPHCKSQRKPTPQQSLKMGRFVEGTSAICFPVGCTRCLQTGYSGRRALFELLTVTDDLRDVILRKATIADIRETLKLTMFTSLQQVGFQLVAEGVTSFDEVERVAGVD